MGFGKRSSFTWLPFHSISCPANNAFRAANSARISFCVAGGRPIAMTVLPPVAKPRVTRPPERSSIEHRAFAVTRGWRRNGEVTRSEEHTSELQSLMRISYAVFCLKKKNKPNTQQTEK